MDRAAIFYLHMVLSFSLCAVWCKYKELVHAGNSFLEAVALWPANSPTHSFLICVSVLRLDCLYEFAQLFRNYSICIISGKMLNYWYNVSSDIQRMGKQSREKRKNHKRKEIFWGVCTMYSLMRDWVKCVTLVPFAATYGNKLRKYELYYRNLLQK